MLRNGKHIIAHLLLIIHLVGISVHLYSHRQKHSSSKTLNSEVKFDLQNEFHSQDASDEDCSYCHYSATDKFTFHFNFIFASCLDINNLPSYLSAAPSGVSASQFSRGPPIV